MSDEEAAPQVSATVILDQLKIARDVHGDRVVADAIASLDEHARRDIEALLPGTWCSTQAAQAVKTAIAERLGQDVLAFQRATVRAGIERTLTTVWRFFMRQLGDAALAKRAPTLYSRSFNRGSLVLASYKRGEWDFELHGWPRIPEFDLVGLMAGIETVIELAGRKHPEVKATRRGSVVHIKATWRP